MLGAFRGAKDIFSICCLACLQDVKVELILLDRVGREPLLNYQRQHF